ncbi:MAG TPA: hypothetical protein VHO06_12250, partial [Polyangia bacterium]|nr:hypothetical protein [Polyangia bacterium]
CSGRCAGKLPARLHHAALAAAGAALLGAACQSTSAVPPYGISPHVDTGVPPHVDAGASADASPDAGDAKK